MTSATTTKESFSGIVEPYSETNVTGIAVKSYCRSENENSDSATLKPLESVLVQCAQSVSMPENTTATVVLKNELIEQGLAISAPTYHSGQSGRVGFRVINIGNREVELGSGDSIACLMPYHHDRHEATVGDLKKIEMSLYVNTSIIMIAFIVANCLVEANISLVDRDTAPLAMLVINLCTVGTLVFLGFFIQKLLNVDQKSDLLLMIGITVTLAAIAALVFG